MYSSFLVLLLATARWCSGQLNGVNASTLTASGQLNSAIQQIAASYFPSSIQPSLAVALGSASISGDPKALVSSLVTAASPPPYITASPLAPYSSRIAEAESLISSVQQAVYNATAPHTSTRNVTSTTTASNGTALVTTVPVEVFNGSTITSAATAGATGASGGSSSQPASTAGGSGSSSSSSGLAMPTEVPVAAAGIIGLLGALAAL